MYCLGEFQTQLLGSLHYITHANLKIEVKPYKTYLHNALSYLM